MSQSVSTHNSEACNLIHTESFFISFYSRSDDDGSLFPWCVLRVIMVGETRFSTLIF